MSYEIFRYVERGEPSYTLKGKGEHEGTNLTLRQRDLASFPAYNTLGQFAAELDRRFLLRHHDRGLTPEDPET